MSDPSPRIRFQSDAEWERVQRAAEHADFDDPTAFVREAALRLVNEVLDEDGRLECPHDDCDRTFATIRERRGHLGSSEHALNVPEGEFWCGYCGYGPTSWRGVNAHHGQSDHDGSLVRLDEEPDREDLLAPEDVPDHKNPELLERLYHEHDGNYTEMCREQDFDVTPGRVRHYLIEFGIHEPTTQGPADEDGPRYRDPEWLEEQYEAADGNISEMHRRIDVDVPYRTLVKNLKRFDIHDPTDPPAKIQACRQQDDSDHDAGSDETEDEQEDPDEEPKGLDHTDPEDLQAAFDRHDTLRAAAEEFPQVTYATVRQRMIDHGIYEPDSYDTSSEDSTATDPGPDPEPPEEPEPDPTPEPGEADEPPPLGVKDPAEVDSFHDLNTPDWLDEASFYQAVEMADDVEGLAEVLGWREYDLIERMVELLGVGENLDDHRQEVMP
jgi:hypothetical protein